MAITIAVTGKGGVGKTAVTALSVLALVEHDWRPLLVVDADPNLNLDAALGVSADETIGAVREWTSEQVNSTQAGMSTTELFEMRIHQSLVEGEGFDLIAMGRPEGPGCYCYANEILRNVLKRMGGNYKGIVVDCEAGLEHLSRRTAGGSLDLMLVLSDPTVRGLQTARRALDLVEELHTSVGDAKVVLNRVRGEPAETLMAAAEELNLEIAACLPEDEQLAALDAAGRPLTELPAESPLRQAVAKLLTDWLTGNEAAGSG